MADIKEQEGDKKVAESEEEEIAVVEVDEDGDEITPPKKESKRDARLEEDDDDDDDDDGEEDNDEEMSPARRRRLRRRQMQRRAREAAEAELAELRAFREKAERKFAEFEGFNRSNTVADVDRRLEQTQRDIAAAERIHAEAIKAGNGDDAVQALRIRDNILSRQRQLFGIKQQFSQQPPIEAPQPAGPSMPEPVQRFAEAWMAENPWYDPRSGDEDSVAVTQIDAQLVREGFDPSTREYWEELTDRASEYFAENDKSSANGSGKTRRKAPPTGGRGSHAPSSTRKNEVRVTPERKAAMQEAGVWDDPELRAKALKAYRDFDMKQTDR